MSQPKQENTYVRQEEGEFNVSIIVNENVCGPCVMISFITFSGNWVMNVLRKVFFHWRKREQRKQLLMLLCENL